MADRDRVLPFTLTELLALLFFALALALAFQWMKRNEAETEIAENREIIDATRQLPPEARASLAGILTNAQDSIPEDFRDLSRRLESNETTRQRVAQALRESGMDSSRVEASSTEALLDSLAARLAAERAKAEALAEESQVPDSARDPLDRMARQLGSARDSLRMCEEQSANTRNQLANCQRRVGNGLDHPPCWADEFGRIEYVYETTVHTNTVTVEAIWPPGREDDARIVPGMLALPGDSLSYQEFARRALPVFAWSQRQNPECRFFVRIVDEVDGGKQAFKDALLTVERFFYKYLVN